MTRKFWALDALDTLFFRDGSPNNAGEGGLGGVGSVFPPPITAIQGMIRTFLAASQGWRPGDLSIWPSLLGDETSPGDVCFEGPYLLSNGEMLFPAPLHVVWATFKDDGRRLVRLVPGPEIACDMGNVRLPQVPGDPEAVSTVENKWLTAGEMATILAGRTPSGFADANEHLWEHEYKVGIARDAASRTAAEHMLYSIRHIRPARGTQIGVIVGGIPEEWYTFLSSSLPVVRAGGDGGMAAFTISPDPPALPAIPSLESQSGCLRYTVTLITPGSYGRDTSRIIRWGPPGITGTCISACVGRVEYRGGWNMRDRVPRPLCPLVPPGSTWFYEAPVKALPDILKWHGKRTGPSESVNLGYGQVLIGRWEE